MLFCFNQLEISCKPISMKHFHYTNHLNLIIYTFSHGSRKRSSDILAFVKQMTGNSCQFLGVVTLPANSSFRVLLERATLLRIKSNNSTRPQWLFEILPIGSTFDMDNMPTGEVETGTVLIFKVKMEHKSTNREHITGVNQPVSSKGVTIVKN
jgi:hypothetical protein